MMKHSLGEFEELVLLIIGAWHEKAYGVLILKTLEDKVGKKINISAVHVTLKRLESRGFVKSGFGDAANNRGGLRKRFYVMTASGKKVLDHQYALRNNIYRQIPKISFG